MTELISNKLPQEYGGRVGRMRARITPEAKILEIGGSYNAVAPRSLGFNTYTVDHADREALLDKYKTIIDNPKIEHVDFICHDGNLIQAIGPEHYGTFDVCIASHVIEHMTNPIAFLHSVEKMLKPNGVFTMAVPDKRGCFDFFRPVTVTSGWLDAFQRNASIHSAAARFDFEAYTVARDGVIVWGQADLGRFSFASSGLRNAYQVFKQVGLASAGPYYDIHSWVFVPASFTLIMIELHALGLTTFLPTNLHTEGWCEFFVDLVLNGRATISDVERLRLLKQAAAEQIEALGSDLAS